MWDSETSMRAFRSSNAHMVAMPKLLTLCDEASYTHWTAETSTSPTMEDAYERIKNTGRLSKVNRPSAAHAAGRTVSESVPRRALTLKPGTRDGRRVLSRSR